MITELSWYELEYTTENQHSKKHKNFDVPVLLDGGLALSLDGLLSGIAKQSFSITYIAC